MCPYREANKRREPRAEQGTNSQDFPQSFISRIRDESLRVCCAADTGQRGDRNIQAWLLWGVLFGSIGMGFFIYGKKQRAVIPLLCGIALIVFPYFVSNVWMLVGIGVLLMAIPYFLRL